MKHNAIIRIVLWSLSAVVLLGLLLVGLALGGYLYERDPDGDPVTGIVSLSAENIESIEIQWVAGNVDVTVVPNAKDIRFSETNGEERSMVYRVKGKTLIIQYCKNSLQFDFGAIHEPTKSLTVEVPVDWVCQTLDIDAASADVSVTLLNLTQAKVVNVSGDTTLHLEKCESVDVKNVSGDTTFVGQCATLDCYTVSGGCDVFLSESAQRINMESVSGGINISVFKECGFTAKLDSVSGKLYSDYSTDIANGAYIYGDGAMQIRAKSVSGSVHIAENTLDLTTVFSGVHSSGS